MSQPRSDIDLEEFARDAGKVPRPRGRWRRFALPVVVLVGFAAVLLWSLSDALLPRREVTVLRPRLAAGQASAGGVAFQAAGWVEPEPFAQTIVPLTPGTIEAVLVQESDPVKRGDVVARLVAEDARLERDQAKVALQQAEAERDRARTHLQFAKEDFTAAISLTERVAVARAEVAGREAESRRLAEAARRAGAEVKVQEEELAIQKHLASNRAAGPRQVELATARVESARAAHAVAEAAAAQATAALGVARARLTSATKDQELRIEDRRTVALAETGLAVADATVARAMADLALAELRLSRVEVRSPWDGIVLERLAQPGSRVGTGGAAGGAVCSIYDPARLRVRVDVPQEHVGDVTVGQAASVRCEARRATPYTGEVIRVVHRADNQKVTLQVHVRIQDGDALLRPEMLCQVRFLAVADRGAAGQPPATGQVLQIPARLLVDGNRVWVLDPVRGAAQSRTVEVGARQGEWVEVRTGLNISDKLIDDGRAGLTDGTTVRVKAGSR